jgi:small subunit ribosomal protein S2
MFYNKLFTIRSLLENGVHYGHTTKKWNPKMAHFIYGIKNGVHIIDLEQTASLLDRALFAIKSVAAKGGKILFLSTKKNSPEIIAAQAKRCGQYYVNKRWLGGMLSNWATVSASVDRMQECATLLSGDNSLFKKKEKLLLQRKSDKLESVLGGISTMGTTPDLLFVIDAQKHRGAIREANSMGIEVCAVVDTNSDPTGIDYIIPGNDDARKAIELYMTLAAEAAIAGTYEALAAANITDIDETMDIKALQELTIKKPTPSKKPSSSFSKMRNNKRSPKAKV